MSAHRRDGATEYVASYPDAKKLPMRLEQRGHSPETNEEQG